MFLRLGRNAVILNRRSLLPLNTGLHRTFVSKTDDSFQVSDSELSGNELQSDQAFYSGQSDSDMDLSDSEESGAEDILDHEIDQVDKQRIQTKKEAEDQLEDEEIEGQAVDEQRKKKIEERRQLRSKRKDYSLGTVTVPQGLRDRIKNLISKYYKKRKYMSPTLHVGKQEFTEKEEKYLEEKPAKRDRIRTPSRLENKKLIRQALHAHIFSDPVDAKEQVERGKFPQIIFGKAESLAYVENFMTGQYSIINRILHEIEIKLPAFLPRMVLDFGSGPGTSLFAVDEVWGDNICKHYLAIEPSSAMLDISQTLTKFDTRVLYRRYLSMGKEVDDYDLVISSCSFTYLQTVRERR